VQTADSLSEALYLTGFVACAT